VFIGCGEGVCVGARSCACQRWVHSLGIFRGVVILVIHTLFLAILDIFRLCYLAGILELINHSIDIDY
jgi:hypothetical protein